MFSDKANGLLILRNMFIFMLLLLGLLSPHPYLAIVFWILVNMFDISAIREM